MIPLRNWQSLFLDVFKAFTDKSFLLVACPGAGKTIAAIEAAALHDRIVVVVPSREIKRGWIKSFRAAAGRKSFDPTRDGWPPPVDASVVVITYAGVATFAPEIRAWLAATDNGMMILDEVHHGGENDDGPTMWAKPILQIAEKTVRDLLCTGTPVRTGGDRIPLVDYRDDGEMVVNYRYGFREAWMDAPPPIRFVRFHGYDVDTEWKRRGKPVESTDLSDAKQGQESTALLAALAADSALAQQIALRVYDDVMARREIRRRAAGLFICRDKRHAKALKAMMVRLGMPEPALILSDDTETTHTIEDFRNGDVWAAIVVRMITEGVDVPRCEVLGYLTHYRTPLFFHQAIGRVLRTTEDKAPVEAVVHYPMSPTLNQLVAEIDVDLRYALREQEAREEREAGGDEREPPEIEYTDSFDAREVKVVGPGQDQIDAGYIQALQAKMPDASKDTLTQFARLLVEQGVIDQVVEPERPRVFNSAEKDTDELRQDLKDAVGRLAGARMRRSTDGTYQDQVIAINATIKRRFNVSGRAQMTDEQLREAIRVARQWLSEGTD